MLKVVKEMYKQVLNTGKQVNVALQIYTVCYIFYYQVMCEQIFFSEK